MNEVNFYKLYQDDCFNILKNMEKESVNLAVIDAPYNNGIVSWDKINNYLNWLKIRLIEVQKVLRNNGTMWFFHNDFLKLSEINDMIHKETDFVFKQFITINKGLSSIAGRTSDNLRSYPTATEYLVFYTFEDLTGSERLSEKFSKLNPMAKYLKSEFERAEISNKEISKLFPSKTGGLTGCVSNWLLGLNFPTEEQYKTIREHLNGNKDDLYLRREYEDLRYTFNLQKGITDVWDINFYKDNVCWHPTCKPTELIKRIVLTSTNKGDVVLDPFLGSGTTMKVCQDTGRSCIGIELNEGYIEKIKKRCWNRIFLDREVKYEFINVSNKAMT